MTKGSFSAFMTGGSAFVFCGLLGIGFFHGEWAPFGLLGWAANIVVWGNNWRQDVQNG